MADAGTDTAMSAVIRSESDQPTTMRVSRSMTVERCSHPSPVRRYAMSPTSL